MSEKNIVTFETLAPVDGLEGPKNISTELFRTYVLPNGRHYSIFSPVALYFKKGSHRVVDAGGTTHYVQFTPDVVLLWKNRDANVPVNF